MAKGGRKPRAPTGTSRELQALKEYADSLAPQLGFFSTLDELVQQAPFERGSAEQWSGYLKPGRMLKREGIQFPLKKEELDYVFDSIRNNSMRRIEDADSISRDELLQQIREYRPYFGRRRGTESLAREEVQSGFRSDLGYEDRTLVQGARFGPEYDKRLSHQSPGSTYEENVTRMEANKYRSHFGDDTLSWSRSSSHQLPSGERMRLVEEIQSDLHEKAAERMAGNRWREYATPEEIEGVDSARARLDEAINTPGHPNREALADAWRQALHAAQEKLPRVGYRDPEALKLFDLFESSKKATYGDRFLEVWGVPRRFETLGDAQNFVRSAYTDNPALGDRIASQIHARPLTGENIIKWLNGREDWDGHSGTSGLPAYSIHDYGPDHFTTIERRLRQAGLVPDEVKAEASRALYNQAGAPPDAPFKGPGDYGALELRKQLLDAVNAGDDYLALIRGKNSADRYEGEDYFEPGSPERAGMEYIYDQIYPSALRALARRYGTEVVDIEAPVGTRKDFRPPGMRALQAENILDYVNEVDAMDSWRERHDFLLGLPRELGATGSQSEELRKLARRITDLQEELHLDHEKVEPRTGERLKWYDGKVAALKATVNEYVRQNQGLLDARIAADPNAETSHIRSFPALRLTPEVRERIKKVGVPLWSLVGGAVVFDDETEGGFAKGGRVRKVIDRIDRNLKEIDESGVGMTGLGLIPPLAYSTYEEYQQYKRLREIERKLNEREEVMIPKFDEGGYVGAAKAARPTLSQRLDDLRDNFIHGFKTQWTGLDEDGVIRGAFDAREDAPRSEWISGEGGELVPPPYGVTPGIVNDTIGVPAFFGYEGSETVNEAAARSAELDQALRDESGLAEPDGWEDYIGGAAGVMAGQVPMPGGFLKGPVGALGKYVPKIVKTAREAIRRIPGAKTTEAILSGIPEFMLPTIEPSPSNYALGTAAGAALMKYLPMLRSEDGATPEDINWDDPTLPDTIQSWVEAGELDPADAEFLIREIAERRGTLGPSNEETYVTGGGFAKGGVVKFRGLKDRILAHKQKLNDELWDKLRSGKITPEEFEANDRENRRLYDNLYKLEDTEAENELAKGGRVKPPSDAAKLALRERLVQLMQESEPPSAHPLVPVEKVDPGTGEPISVEVPPEMQTPLLETPISRRTVLKGARDLAGAAMSPIDLDPLSMLESAVKSTPAAAIRAPISFSPNELQAFLLEAAPALAYGPANKHWAWQILENAEDSDSDVWIPTIGDQSERFTKFMKDNGVWMHNEGDPDGIGDLIHYDPQGAERIRDESNRIFDWYEYGYGLRHGLPPDVDPIPEVEDLRRRALAGEKDPWEEYGLGGDDDVDYHGGYVDDFLDAFEEFRKFKETGEMPTVSPARREWHERAKNFREDWQGAWVLDPEDGPATHSWVRKNLTELDPDLVEEYDSLLEELAEYREKGNSVKYYAGHPVTYDRDSPSINSNSVWYRRAEELEKALRDKIVGQEPKE